MKPISRKHRAELMAMYDQWIAGMEGGDKEAEDKARAFLYNSAVQGSKEHVLTLLRGTLQSLEQMQPEVDEDLKRDKPA